eukprot:XP_008768329.1 PREDICTED: zinc finger and SCAN domain-containing protein 20 isoform X1 [Rattus norvegicus]
MESGPGKHWTEEEVKALLSVWAERNIRKQLYGTLRNREIFIYVAKRLRSLGVYRDWKQCRAKYKNLKYEYRTVKHAHRSGDSSRTMKFFHVLDAILQSEPTARLTEESDGNIKCLVTLSSSSAPEITEGNRIPLEGAESHTHTVTSNDPGAGRHQPENEVTALVQIWHGERVRQTPEETTRNKGTSEETAQRPIQFGIDRDWKQCHDATHKTPNREQRVLQKTNDSPWRKRRFHDETDCILKSRTPGITKRKHESPEGHFGSLGTGSNKRKAQEGETMSTPLKKMSPEIITNWFPQSLIDLEGSTGCFFHQDPHLHQVNFTNV